ncbi:beta-propeller domain-containing protein [Sorangium sp. So ce1335]|uniref:beta-propeller domain-containing protein n=1 Tax=Sorangium sp. So ce1335 TaxID=3133335 RepID=UPI003F5F1780
MRSLPRTFTPVSLLALGVGFTACSVVSGGSVGQSTSDEPDEPDEPEVITVAQSALTPAASCDEVEALLRERLKQHMLKSVDAIRESTLSRIEQGCDWYFDGGVVASSGTGATTGGGPTSPAAGGDAGGEAAEYSTTNTQEADVDEADFIKNDGGHVYLLAHGKLQIFDAWPAAETHRLASVAIEGEPKKLFVHDKRALVYSSLTPASGGDYTQHPGGECTYGYDCEFTGDGWPLVVTELDLSDLSAPTVVRTMKFSGSLINARRIGNVVHTVVSSPEPTVDGLSWLPDGIDACALAEEGLNPGTVDAVNDAFDALVQENLELIDAAPLDLELPTVEDTIYRDGVAHPRGDDPFAGCENYYLSNTGDGHSFLSVVSTELGGEGLGQTTVVGKPGAVYANAGSLYVASRHTYGETYGWFYDDGKATPEATTVHQFALRDSATPSAYMGSGVVKGRVLNQFAMSEHEGYLRVATTTGHLPDPDTHNTVASMKLEGGEIVVKGVADNLAPGEDIRSVRFHGDVGFMVTFKKTDPLFTLDLSNPEAPRVRGELKIPGFSTYMHMIDPGHVMSIGYDADDQGDFAFFQGIMLQIFDVTNLDDPKLTHKEVIGTRGSTSDAATDHLAFNYFAQRGLLGIPMVICEGGGGGQFGDAMKFSGLLVYKVDVDEGFTSVGGVPHPLPDTSSDPYYAGCSSWWTQSNSYVKRSVFLEDYVYSVSEDEIRVAHVSDLASPAAVVSLAP